MNIHEISEKYRITLPKLKRMQKAGLLICDAGDGHPLAASMRANLANKNSLSAEQIFVLIENPEVFAELRQRQDAARAQIRALGDYVADRPAPAVLADFREAAGNDPDAIRACMFWLKTVITENPVGYQWIAVRIAQLIKNPTARAEFLNLLRRALFNIKREPSFAAWFTVDKTGARTKTVFSKPKTKKEFDL